MTIDITSEEATTDAYADADDVTEETGEELAEDTGEDTAGEPGDGPSVIYTTYFTAAEDLVEHVRAADVLNLGFRVESYLVASDDPADAGQIEYEFTLLSELPLKD
ncbi:hypothetical protein GCM10009827_055670 [Dactylosporangium maewongense]|uniref:Uncharacterized protein n=1 Tax=Dactylosporangium maewongense TaxID=634393 RepID=A0ABN2B150_9ACTN